MKQFQVQRTGLAKHRIIAENPAAPPIADGEILVAIERFGMSANNITYGIAGDTLGYWKFFKALENPLDEWGILPVWGFAKVIAARCDGIEIGERLFGYFPPSSHLVMQPARISESHFFDGVAHRGELPGAYNIYRRLRAEPGYTRSMDDLRMLLFPLFLTSFAIWDQLKENRWYGAEQIVIVSASAKTSIGLAFALHEDSDAPFSVGLTSKGNREFVRKLGYYNQVGDYENLAAEIKNVPTVIIDMAGNAQTLGALHTLLGDNLIKNIDVGITDWKGARKDPRINRDKREFFFAPARIQKRIKDWGVDTFSGKSNGFIMKAARQSGDWLKLEKISGLEGLEAIFADIRDGKIPPEKGLVVEM